MNDSPTPRDAAIQSAAWSIRAHFYNGPDAQTAQNAIASIIESRLSPLIEQAEAEKAALATQVAVMRDEEAQRVKLKAVQVLIDKNQHESDRKCREAMEAIGISTHWSYNAGKTVGAMTLELVELVKKVTAHKSATELCADRPNLAEYVAQLERERDQALARAADDEREAARRKKWSDIAEEDIQIARDLFVAAGALESYDGDYSPSELPECAKQIITERDTALAKLAACEGLLREACHICGYHPGSAACSAMHEAPRCRVAALTAGGDGWVKCSERMPEDRRPVLCQFASGVMAVGDYDSRKTSGSAVRDWGWFFSHPYPGVPPTHWQPLPTRVALETAGDEGVGT